MAAGSISNMFDRLVRGHVVDYVGFRLEDKHLEGITYNFADFFIAAGAVITVMTKLFRPGSKKKKKAKSVALYLLGSAAVTVGMAAVMPKVMGKVGQKIYTESLKKQGDDDWTQEILNRRQAEAEAEEEKKNG